MAVFTEREMRSARYLTLLPINNLVNITNQDEAFLFSCKKRFQLGEERFNHKDQVGVFEISRFPETSDHIAFFASNTGPSEIFADSRVYALAQDNGLRGLDFQPVRCLEQPADGAEMYQLRAEHTIPFERIVTGSEDRIKKCPGCGRPEILCGPDYTLCLNMPSNRLTEDFYMTERIFGEGFTYPIYFMSQRFYGILRRGGLLQGVETAPVRFLA